MSRRNVQSGPTPSSENLYKAVRLVTFERTQLGKVQRSSSHPDVYGMLIDIARQDGFNVALAAPGDGSASLYSNLSGPMAVIQSPVADQPIRNMFTTAQNHLEYFSSRDDERIPPTGIVRFHLINTTGGRFADVTVDAFFGRADHPLRQLIFSANKLFEQIRTGGNAR